MREPFWFFPRWLLPDAITAKRQKSSTLDTVPSTENYVEVTLKPLDAPANQSGSKNIIILLVPRSEIDNHRAEHQEKEAAIDQLIAQALAEERALDALGRLTISGGSSPIERSKFLSERPGIIEGRSPDYERDGFQGWFF